VQIFEKKELKIKNSILASFSPFVQSALEPDWAHRASGPTTLRSVSGSFPTFRRIGCDGILKKEENEI